MLTMLQKSLTSIIWRGVNVAFLDIALESSSVTSCFEEN